MDRDSDTRARASGNQRPFGFMRWGAMICGGALALVGLSRRSKSGVALAAAGGLLAYRGATLAPEDLEFHTESSFAINCSPEKAFQFWRNFENLTQFMRNLDSVKVFDDRRSEWNAVGRFGKPIHWQAEIVEERPNEWIVWQSLPDSDLDCRGSVHFFPAVGKRGIIVSVALQYRPPAGAVGRTVALMLAKDPEFMLREDLRRFKALMEAGEVPNIDDQTHGPRSALGKAIQAAYPEKRKPAEFETNLRELRTQRSAS